MDLDPVVAGALRELRERIERELPGRLARLVVFGSTARGEAGDESDLDVLVLLADPAIYAERAWIVDQLAEIALARGLIPAPVVLTVAEWEEMKRRELLFAEEVEHDGIVA